MPSLREVLLVVGMLISGTVNTVSKKAQNYEWSWGIDGNFHQFSKPWFQTLIMFLGEILCLAYFAFTLWRARARTRASLRINTLLLTDTDAKVEGLDTVLEEVPQKHSLLIFWLPACLDLVGTSLGGIGLVYTTASVFQMLRGSIIIFTGVLSKIFLKRQLNVTHWSGMLVTAGGIVLVGYASLRDKDPTTPTSHYVALGDCLVIAGQLCNAIQFVVEEVFVKGKQIPPPKVVGMEGVFGAAMMIVVVLPAIYFIPGSDNGSYENFIDAFLMIGNNVYLLLFILLYLFSIAFYNFFGLSVTKQLTTVHRTFIDALRTLLVWGCSVSLHYITKSDFGEPWDSHSYIQLIGFAIMVLGTLMYNQIIRIPIPDGAFERCCVRHCGMKPSEAEYSELKNQE